MMSDHWNVMQEHNGQFEILMTFFKDNPRTVSTWTLTDVSVVLTHWDLGAELISHKTSYRQIS